MPPVRVGVSTVLMNDKGEVLVGKRIGSHGASELFLLLLFPFC